MVIDTSAVLSIIAGEEEASRLAVAIQADPIRLLSAATALEAAFLVEGRFGDDGARQLDGFFFESDATLVAFSTNQFRLARQAFRTYGKGRHEAALNLGDCFAYALSKESGQPLLFKGRDFARTDVEAVPY